jgi:hypothetical protein
MTYKNSVSTSQETDYVTATKPNRLMLFIENHTNTQIHCVSRMQGFGMLKQKVYIVTTGLWRVKQVHLAHIQGIHVTRVATVLPRLAMLFVLQKQTISKVTSFIVGKFAGVYVLEILNIL